MMLKGVSNKRKFHLLMLTAGIAPLLVYWLAISDTVTLIQECSELKERYQQVGDIDMEVSGLQSQLAVVNDRLGSTNSDDGSFQTQLLATTTEFCKSANLEVVGMTRPRSYIENDLVVETIPVKVEGGFIDAVKLIQYLETEAGVGRIISVEYALERLSSSRKNVLYTTINVQRINKNS